MKSYTVLGYAYDAALHCCDCASKTEGDDVYPVFADQVEEGDTCDDCLEPLLEG